MVAQTPRHVATALHCTTVLAIVPPPELPYSVRPGLPYAGRPVALCNISFNAAVVDLALILCNFPAYSSIYLTVSFTIERYIAVCHPIRGQAMCTESRAKKVIAGLLKFQFTIYIPYYCFTVIALVLCSWIDMVLLLNYTNNPMAQPSTHSPTDSVCSIGCSAG